MLCLRNHPAGQQHLARLDNQHGKSNALTILAHQLARVARAVYDMLKRDTGFDMDKVLHG